MSSTKHVRTSQAAKGKKKSPSSSPFAGFYADMDSLRAHDPLLADDLENYRSQVIHVAIAHALQGVIKEGYGGPWKTDERNGDYTFSIEEPCETRTRRGQCWLLDRPHAEQIAEVVGGDDDDDDDEDEDGRRGKIKRQIMWDSRQAFDHWLTSSSTRRKTENAFFHISGRPKSGKSQLIHEIFDQRSGEIRKRLQLEWCSPANKKLVLGCAYFHDYSKGFGPDGLKNLIRGILWALIVADHQLTPLLFPHRFEEQQRLGVLRKLAHSITPRRCWKKKQPQREKDDNDDEAKGEEIEHSATPEAVREPKWPPFRLEDSELFAAWNLLIACNKVYADRKICLLLDGINRFDEGEHGEMLNALKQWVRARPGNVKICITSRGEAAFQEALESHPGFTLHDANYLDQLWYTRNQLTAYRDSNKEVSRLSYIKDDCRKAEQARIEHELIRTADGDYPKLWKMVRNLEMTFCYPTGKSYLYRNLDFITGRRTLFPQ